MTQLHCVPRRDLPDGIAAMLDATEQLEGDANFLQAGANAPELLEWYFDSFYKRGFYEGRVDIRTKELLRLQLSKRHGCFY